MTARRLGIASFILLTAALAAPAEEVRGVVRQVDPGRKELIIEGRGRGARGLLMTFEVPAEARVVIGAEAGRLPDLRPGQHVRVSFEDRDGRHVAQGILARGALLRPPTPAADDIVTGALARVDRDRREIVVIGPAPEGDGDAEIRLSVPARARITRDRKEIRWEDLKEGEAVAVRTEKHGTRLFAAEIGVGAAGLPVVEPVPGERVQRALKLADWILRQVQEKRD